MQRFWSGTDMLVLSLSATLVTSDPNLQHKFFGFVRKVMSLTVSSFVAALLLDADNIPLADPADLWDMPSSKAHGNLFWPDFWAEVDSEASEVVYDMVGLKYEQTKAILSAGKGKLQRTTESGQVLLDLVRHADVAEWALWINSFGDDVYRAMWGDKDTYSLSFAVAGKAQEFRQLQVGCVLQISTMDSCCSLLPNGFELVPGPLLAWLNRHTMQWALQTDSMASCCSLLP
eukprot:GHRR01018502.1.p1 GENE.GHRR01018502.1~~GHRR01018502.1.p1  ORF type:complete len:231 (+),score=69.63 GHRR01018502.1:650-1342(+)